MDIQICPVKILYQLLKRGIAGKCGAVISSSSDIDQSKLGPIPYIARRYEDLDYECAGRSFSEADAAAVAEFVKGLGQLDTLYFCCDAGESRSPAAAAAVMRYVGLDDMPVWQNPRYHPNMLVFSLLAEALDVPVSDEDRDLRFYTNQKAFRDAIRGSR